MATDQPASAVGEREAAEHSQVEKGGWCSGKASYAAEEAAVSETALAHIVEACGGEEAAEGCLEEVHSCMVPFKMGDTASCRCFAGAEAKRAGSGGEVRGTGAWEKEGWCTPRCRGAVYGEYSQKVRADTGLAMGCGIEP